MFWFLHGPEKRRFWAAVSKDYHAVEPVSAACAAFTAQPSAYSPSTRKPDVAPTCGRTKNSTDVQRSGFGRKRRCSGMDETCRLRRGEGYGACIDEAAIAAIAGQSCGVVRAPRRSHLPTVRAVLGISEGVPNTAKNSRRALQNEKSPPFQGIQRGSNEKHEVNTEKW